MHLYRLFRPLRACDILVGLLSPISLHNENKIPPIRSLAQDILSVLNTADANGANFVQSIQLIVCETGWRYVLGAAVLTGLEHAPRTEMPMGEGVPGDNAAGVLEDVWKFAKKHSEFVAGVSLGILVVLAPSVVEVMGFVE